MTLRSILMECFFWHATLLIGYVPLRAARKLFQSSLLSLEHSCLLIRAEMVSFTFMTVVWEARFLGTSKSFAA